MRKILFFLFLSQIAYAYPPLPKPRDEEEALLVRRIVTFWRDHDYDLAKFQLQQYLQNHQDSPFQDHFFAMLGDIFLHQKKYQEALSFYEKIHHPSILSEVKSKRFQALYLLQRYHELYHETKENVENLNSEGKFYFAESCFREGVLLSSLEEGKKEAQFFFLRALPVYQGLLNEENYKNFSKLAIAEIYRLMGDNEKAAPLYLEVASEKKDPNVLFHAALMLQNIDRKKAAQILEELTHAGHQKAALQWMHLLAKDKNWQEIKKNRDLFLSFSDEETLGLSFFYQGMAAFEENDYLQVVLDLTKSLSCKIKEPFERSALLVLMTSAKEIGKVEAAEKALSLLKNRYPDDVPEAIYLQALCYVKAKELKKALTALDGLLTLFPDHPLSANALFEKIRLLTKMEEWKQARENLLVFFGKYPDSSLKLKMASLAVDLSLTQLGFENVFRELVQDIERGLQWKAFEDEKEKKLLLAKAYIKLDKIHEALKILLEMENPDSLLLTQCYVKLGNAAASVIEYGEKALVENPNLEILHLQLFNAYQALYLEKKDPCLAEKAALHLNKIIDDYPVSLENRLWLAHHFAKVDQERAISLLEAGLQTDSNVKKFYSEALLLSELYKKEKHKEKEHSLLEKMIFVKGGEEPFAELSLADFYLSEGKKEEAQKLYQKLTTSAAEIVAAKAKLQKARLDFLQDPEKGLKGLHELSVKRILSTEPTHLEAAIDYVERKASLVAKEDQDEVLLEQFLLVKEDFTSKDNISAKDYHVSRELLPDKDKVYQAYMRYLDARIYLLQSKFSVDISDKKTKEHAAKALLSTLRQGKYAVSDYLVEKAREKLHEE